MRRFPPSLALLVSSLVGCDGAPRPRPSPSPPPVHPVEALVFYDENANGLQDGREDAVVPGAEVEIAGRTAAAAAGTGRVTVNNVPEGEATASLVPASLPPYYAPGAPVQITVPLPEGEVVRVGATLPIGPNVPARYMAFGDSITDGDGSSSGYGYRRLLQNRLTAHFGGAEVVNQSVGGTRSWEGAERISQSLRRNDPAYTLVLYGTNDWNARECRNIAGPPCFTVDSLRSIVRAVKGQHSLPIVGTIIPVNTGFDARTPESRNVWVADVNELVRAMVEEEGAVLAELFEPFMAVPDFHTLFYDHVHPNDEGYDIIASAFFEAITTPLESSSGATLGGDLGLLATPEPILPRRPPRSRGPFRR
ncbi:MAG TPA: SGNH/GDSL hydrolase family protein [Vicinamibacteria bacterium]|nr:SGNH/GDSL hydrolase family protein [Vicinamibacteria bacterium]